jgi:uncharacterized protein YejL (UPF0352 family)
MNIKLPEPAINQECWGYNACGEISWREPNLIGYSPKQVGDILSELKNALVKARVTFDELSKLGNGDCDGNSIGNSIAQDARAEIDKLFYINDEM